MLVNFVHPNLKPCIECSAVSCDGYEIENLISSHSQLKDKGFLAERFVSGPVNIRIKFIAPIHLKHIIIWSNVSNQQSLGFELSSIKIDGAGNEYIKKFASILVTDSNAEGVHFHPTNFVPRMSSRMSRHYGQTFYNSRTHESVSQINVKIFRYKTVAAIKKLEIWAAPANDCNRHQRNEITKLWSQCRKQTVPEGNDSLSAEKPMYLDNKHHKEGNDSSVAVEKRTSSDDDSDRSPSEGTPDTVDYQSEDSVPEEFYDQITHEIMNLPMVLPSGKLVDYHTLERHQIEEAHWGRLPNDPFTGVPFNDHHKPVVSAAIKSRIDLFLARNADQQYVKDLPRRLGEQGRYSDDYAIKVSSILNAGCGAVKRKLDDDDGRRTPEFTFDGKIRRKCEEIGGDGGGVLSNQFYFPSYLEKPEPKPSKSDVRCVACEITSNNQLYKLPCNHVMCRKCVILNDLNVCMKFTCKMRYNNADIEKIHS